MQDPIEKELKSRLSGALRIAVVGIGSELRGDDAAGELVAQGLESDLKEHPGKPEIAVFHGGTAPENLTGSIKKFAPSHIVIIDAADSGKEPGNIFLVSPEEIDGVSFSTHSLPPKILIDYLLHFLKCGIIFIGIQPLSVRFGEPLSPKVRESSEMLVELLSGICNPVKP